MAILTSKERNQLRPAEFAAPQTRSYPIPDARHARNALSRVSQFGSAHEQAQVRTAVHRRFPDIGAKRTVAPKPGHGNKYKSIGHRIVAIGRKHA